MSGQSYTIQCNHQGGLVGEEVINFVIQGITWHKC